MRKVLKFVDHLLYKFMKWSLILLLGVGAFVYYRLEINPLPAESDQDEAMRPVAPPPLPQPARPPPTPSDLERMRRNEAELQAALDAARFLVRAKLRSPYGGPKETFESLEKLLTEALSTGADVAPGGAAVPEEGEPPTRGHDRGIRGTAGQHRGNGGERRGGRH